MAKMGIMDEKATGLSAVVISKWRAVNKVGCMTTSTTLMVTVLITATINEVLHLPSIMQSKSRIAAFKKSQINRYTI